MDNPILQYVASKGSVTAKELLQNLDLPERTLFRDLERLVNEGQLIKIGSRPNVVYTLPNQAIPSSQTPQANTSQTSSSAPPPEPQPASAYPELLLYWCKFLHLDPAAVTVSYHQIRPLVPNYQSIGMSPPKSKKLGLKMPDPIWVRFFNLLTWILAILWTVLKNAWGLFRKFYKGEIPWGPIVMMILASWIIFGLIMPVFVKPKGNSSKERVVETYNEAIILQLEKVSEELSDAKHKLHENGYEIKSLKSQLEAVNQLPLQMEEQKKQYSLLETDLRTTKLELESLERDKRRLEKDYYKLEQEQNARVEELQRLKEDYEERLSSAKAKIKTINKELIQSESQTSSLKYDLEKEQARSAKLKEEMESLRKDVDSK